MNAKKFIVSGKPKCMLIKLPFSDTYLSETKLKILRKTIRELGFSNEDCSLIMQRRRLLKCRKYVHEWRQRDKQLIEEMKKKKIELDLQIYSLSFDIAKYKGTILESDFDANLEI